MSDRPAFGRAPARSVCWGVAGAVLLGLAGCAGPRLSTSDEAAAFRAAGPVRPVVDIEHLLRAKAPAGPYRVVAGDVLELEMPKALRALTPEPASAGDRPLVCRVAGDGKIRLPIVGEVAVAGKTLLEVEAAVAGAYHPKYAVARPAVVVRVAEYDVEPVCVVGAVEKPGVYPLRRDEMSLVNALMKAGGIVRDGAAAVRIRRRDDAEPPEPLLVPIQGLNIPFADVALEGGSTVEVERLRPEFFTVIGLVKAPGAFPYAAGTRYNLMQALAFAGGVNALADPRHVTVYRQDAEGRIVSATFRLQGSEPTDASTVAIKPGDVVAVEQTDRTAARLLIAEILRIHLGINAAALYRYETGDIDYHYRD